MDVAKWFCIKHQLCGSFFPHPSETSESVVTILSKVDVLKGKKNPKKPKKCRSLSALPSCLNGTESKKWKEFSYSRGRVWQSFYIKTNTLQLQWPSSGLPGWHATRRLPSPCWREEFFLFFTRARLDLYFAAAVSVKWQFLYVIQYFSWHLWAAETITALYSHCYFWQIFCKKNEKSKTKKIFSTCFF